MTPDGSALDAAVIRSGDPAPPLRTVAVRHQDWAADLILGANGRLRHGQHGSLGTYYQKKDVLHVVWDQWTPDLFLERGGRFTSIGLLENASLNLRRRADAKVNGRHVELETVVLRLPGSPDVVEVRPGSSDIDVFGAVFLAREYARPELDPPVRTIVDLGANTGLSSAFFAQRYPQAHIVAVEPDAGNIRILRRNAREWRRIVPVHAAIWHEDAILRLRTTDAAGVKLPDWSFQTVPEGAAGGASGQVDVEALSMPTLMRRHGIASVDLLKVDIEGAEYELFKHGSEAWLPAIRCIVVETHERFKPGSDGTVTERLAADFEELPPSGENRIFMRREGQT